MGIGVEGASVENAEVAGTRRRGVCVEGVEVVEIILIVFVSPKKDFTFFFCASFFLSRATRQNEMGEDEDEDADADEGWGLERRAKEREGERERARASK